MVSLRRTLARALAGSLAVTAMALGPAPAAVRAELRMGVSPMKIPLVLDPGEERIVAVEVFNNAEDAVLVVTEVGDWMATLEGGVEFVPREAHSRAASSWIQTDLSGFTVPAHGNQVVRLTVAMPDTACGSYWAIVFFEGQAETRLERLGVRTKVRMATTVYLTARGTEERDDTLTGMAIGTGPEAGILELTARLANRGNTYFYPEGWFQVADPGGEIVFEEELPRRVCLPGRETVYRMPWRPRVAGTHVFLVTVDNGLETLIQGIKQFDPGQWVPLEPIPGQTEVSRAD